MRFSKAHSQHKTYRHSFRRQLHVANGSAANALDPPHSNTPAATAAAACNANPCFQDCRNVRNWQRTSGCNKARKPALAKSIIQSGATPEDTQDRPSANLQCENICWQQVWNILVQFSKRTCAKFLGIIVDAPLASLTSVDDEEEESSLSPRHFNCDLCDCMFTTKVLAQLLLADLHDNFRDLDSKPLKQGRLDKKQKCAAGAPLCAHTCKEFPAPDQHNVQKQYFSF